MKIVLVSDPVDDKSRLPLEILATVDLKNKTVQPNYDLNVLGGTLSEALRIVNQLIFLKWTASESKPSDVMNQSSPELPKVFPTK